VRGEENATGWCPPKSQLFASLPRSRAATACEREFGSHAMSGLIYLVGLIVVILAILSFFGLR
jgi:hypothetical protein